MYGADVSNAFAEAPPPKQGFYIRPDKAFREWWTLHKKRPPLPPGYVIPIQSAMQGHPESPRLWEKHANSILRLLGLTPTIHEPCLYSGIVDGQRVLLMRQVDDFAIATSNESTANALLDLMDNRMNIPLKRQGLLNMFNGIDIVQTKHYIKIDCHSYINLARYFVCRRVVFLSDLATRRVVSATCRRHFICIFLLFFEPKPTNV
jgi:hypothetical protein